MKYLIILLFSFWGFLSKEPEPKVLFKGTVKDTANQALVACSVNVIYPGTGITFKAYTDKDGQFSMVLHPGIFKVRYSYLGYVDSTTAYSSLPKMDTTIQVEIVMKGNKIVEKDITVKVYRSPLVKADESPRSSRSMKFKESRSEDHYAPPASTGMAMKRMSDKVGTRGVSDELSSGETISGGRVKYESSGISTGVKAGTLTAGEINDFSKWVLWNDLSKGELKGFASHWGILPSNRFSILITSEYKSPLCDIPVILKDPNGNVIWKTRTDNTGKAELWANLFDSSALKKGNYKLEAVYEGKTYSVSKASLFSQSMNKLIIPAPCKKPMNMDIVFAVDATGSMGDEIQYLQAEIYDVIEKVKKGNPSLNLHMGSVFYRDKEDSYLTVDKDLTADINQVMTFMKAQSADGGGDEPEGVDAAMEVAIGKFKWREEARARVMFLVLDASPHHDAETLEKLKKYTAMAAQKGIRIVPVVCSGIDKASEFLMRSMALATNGNYIFLTDHSGIGDPHIAPSTDKYSVETLNVLLIRLLQQYIFMPECDQTVNTDRLDSLQHIQSDSASKDTLLVNNPNPPKDSLTNPKPDTWFLKYYPNPCRGILKVDINASISELYIADINGKLIMQIPVSKEQGHIEIDLTQYPAGVYFLRYCVEGVCKSGKFVLMH